MNQLDEQLDRYFEGRAPDVRLPSVPTATIVTRGRRRRHRRTAARCGMVVGAVSLLAGAVALRTGDGKPEQKAATFQGKVPSDLEWSLVTPKQGLGWDDGSRPSAATSEAVYDLSTAPKGTAGNSIAPPHLYRSTDGVEWGEVALPSGLWTDSLAADGDDLYVMGTATSGGSVEVQVARQADDDWDRTTVPLDLTAVRASFPGTVEVSGTDVAVADGTQVVGVALQGHFDGDVFRRAGLDPMLTNTVSTEREGLMVEKEVRVPCAEGQPGPTVPDGPAMECSKAEGDPYLLTWAQLGLDERQASLVRGEVRMFRAEGGGTLAPAGTVTGGSVNLEVTDDGFWALPAPMATSGGLSAAYLSADGGAWDQARSVELPRDVVASGLLDGKPAVASASLADINWKVALSTIDPAGVQTVDVNEALGVQGYVEHAAFGPMGFAAVLSSLEEGPEDWGSVLVHSSASGLAAVALPEAPEGETQVVDGITVTADAITVRLDHQLVDSDGNAKQPAVHRTFVGTPR